MLDPDGLSPSMTFLSPAPTTTHQRTPCRKVVWGWRFRVTVLAILLGCVAVQTAFAQVRVTAAWDANTDGLTAGYQVVVGTTPGVIVATLDVGAATSVVLPLQPGAAYSVTVRAYTATGVLGPTSVEAVVDLTAPPGAPTGVGASVNGPTASLGWSPPMTGGAPLGYMLSLGTAPGASNLVSAYPIGNTQSVSGELPPGTYFARLQAANLLGVGPPSGEVAFQVSGGYRPLSPFGLSATWVGTSAQLTWTRPSGAQMPTSYVIEAGTSPGSANIGSVNVGDTGSFLVDVPPGTYYMRVRGVSASGVSDASNEVVLQGRGAPGPPSDLTSTGAGSVVQLTWRAPASGSVTGYVIEGGTGPGLSNLGVVQVGDVTTLTTNAPPGEYYVRIRAVNARGVSAPSNEIVVRR